MKINEGNVFEAMRILLPEHRAAMEKYRQERDQPTLPTWDEQRLEELDRQLQEALAGKNPVRIWTFTGDRDCAVQGVIVAVYGDMLTLVTDEGRSRKVRLREIVRIEAGMVD